MPPPLTRRGFLRRDVFKELDKALEIKDAENACLYASELVCTSAETMKSFANHLIDVFGQWYVAPDLKAVQSINRSLLRLLTIDYDLDSSILRNTMCDVVITLSSGLPRHSAVQSLLDRIVYVKSDAPVSLADVEVFIQMKDTKRAIIAFYNMWQQVPSGRLASFQRAHIAKSVWDMLVCRVDRHSETGIFIWLLRELFYGFKKPDEHVLSLTSAKQRVGFVLYSILACVSNASSLPITWSIPDTNILIGKSQALIGNVFDAILHPKDEDSGSGDAEVDTIDCRKSHQKQHDEHQPSVDETETGSGKYDYLRMYTTFDYNAICNKNTDPGPNYVASKDTRVIAFTE
jgi:hypothetical protein